MCNKARSVDADPITKFMATEQMMDAQARLQMQIVGQLEAQLGRERGKLDEIMARISRPKIIESCNDAKTPKDRDQHRFNPMGTGGQGEIELIGKTILA